MTPSPGWVGRWEVSLRLPRRASSSPIPVPKGWAHLSLGNSAESGLHGGAQGGGWADRARPPGVLGPNTCRKDQSPHWATLPLCAPPSWCHHGATIPATHAPRDTKNVRWASKCRVLALSLRAVGRPCNVLSGDEELPGGRNHVCSNPMSRLNLWCPEQRLA